MTIKKYFRLLFKKRSSVKGKLEYVEESMSVPSSPMALDPEVAPVGREAEVAPMTQVRVEDVAFSPQSDLEAYVRGLTVSREVIEDWIAAGLLLPEEIKMAEKMIKIMRKNEDTYIH